jgi:predicted Zn finger-like uncharacterized protein
MKAQCPHCKAEFTTREEYSGKKVKCPKCTNFFIVSNDVIPENKINSPIESANNFPSRQAQVEKPEIKPQLNIHIGLIPQKFRQYLNSEEKILYASNPSKGALFLSIALPSFLLIISLLYSFWGGLEVFLTAILCGISSLIIYLSWKNKYYIITDKRTFTSEGIFNIAISIIPNKNIQMICINTGIIDRLLGLNTLEISSAAQGGTNIFHAFIGKSKGTIKLSTISHVHEVIKIYHVVFA